MYLLNRNALGSNLNCLDLLDTFVEVGVLRGDFSNEVLKLWKGKKAILVDLWTMLPSGTPDIVGTYNQEQHDGNYDFVKYRFREDARVSTLKSDSSTTASQFQKESLDCVYLDADHSYAGVTKDLNVWWPTIKDGGLLTGHDFVNAFWGSPHHDPGATWTGVKLAVERFFKDRTDCSCIISSYQDETPSWQVFKINKQIDPKDVLVLSCATDNLTYSHDTEVNHRNYCNKHGYAYEMARTEFWGDSHPAWSKLKFVHERLPHHKWVMWVDADAIFMDSNRSLDKFLIPRMGHVSSTWHAFNRLQLTNGISFWQNIPWTFDFLKSAISHRAQFSWSGVWEEEGIRRSLEEDINNYGRWIGIELTHFNSWPHFNTHNPGYDFIHHWGGVRFVKEKLIADSLAIAQ